MLMKKCVLVVVAVRIRTSHVSLPMRPLRIKLGAFRTEGSFTAPNFEGDGREIKQRHRAAACI